MTKDYAGRFSLKPNSNEYEISGRLSFTDEESLLSLFTDKKIDCDVEAEFFGKIEGPKLVSLLNTVSNDTGMVIGSLGTEFKKSIKAFYCLSGAQHLDSKSKEIRQLTFELDQLSSLFEHQDHFQMLRGEKLKIIKNALSLPEDEKHLFAHFDGTCVLSRLETSFGVVTFENSVRHGFGNASGINIANTVLIRINFESEVNFYKAIQKMTLIRRATELIIGRKQSVRNINLTAFRNSKVFNLKVHAEWLNKVRSSGQETVHFDFLIHPIQDRLQFENVIQNYIRLEDKKKNIRESFQHYLQSTLSKDRLVGAANLFDIFPEGTYPDKFTLAHNESELLAEFKNKFRALPQESKSRDSILGAIGRVSKLSLRDKINHHANIISSAVPGLFPNIEEVIKSIHLCRNHIVHGSEKQFEYFEHWGLVQFLTEACEIIFLFSDLIQCGWKVELYTAAPKYNSNRTSSFLNEYENNLGLLLETIKSHSKNFEPL